MGPYRTDSELEIQLETLKEKMRVVEQQIEERKEIRNNVVWYKRWWRIWKNRCPICGVKLKTVSLSSFDKVLCPVNEKHYFKKGRYNDLNRYDI